MRILHVIESLNPDSGGPPMIAAGLAAAQAGLDCQVTLATHSTPGRDEQIAQTLQSLPHFEQVHLVCMERRGPLAPYVGKGRSRLRRLVADAQVVHVHFSWEPLPRLTAAECRRNRCPYFVLLNGMLDPWSLAQKPWKKRLALKFGTHRMLQQAAALHLGTRTEQQLIEPLKLRAPRIILPNGVFMEELEPLPPSGSFYCELPRLERQPYILFMSRLHHKKGLDLLADAYATIASQFTDTHLVVAGPDDGAGADFERRIADHDLTRRVHLTGPIYGRRKLAALCDCALFCLPSRQEGFSVAIVEALACAAPVVITEGCHFPQVAEAGAGMVVNADGGAVAMAMARLLGDQTLRERMGRAGRELITTGYTWPKIAESVVAAYDRALQSR